MIECQSIADIENLVQLLKFGDESKKKFNRVNLKAKIIAKLKDLVELIMKINFVENNRESYDAEIFNEAFFKTFERYGEKDKNGNIILFWSLFQDEQINKIAYDLKFDYFKGIKEKKFLEDRLVNFLLIRKNFEMFSSIYIDEKRTINDYDFKNNDKYSGEILAKTYKACLKDYGKKYEKDGTITPFMKLFNKYYKVKNQALKKEKLEENQGLQKEIREKNLDIILDDFQDRIGKQIKNKNYKYDDYKRFFKENNATENELQKLDEAFSKEYIQKEAVYTDNSSNNNVLKYSYADKVARIRLEEKNNFLRRLIFLLDEANSKLKNDKDMWAYFKCYVTEFILEEKDYDISLNSYIDEDFRKYYYGNKDKYLNKKMEIDQDKLIGSYLNKKPRTIGRNYREKIKKFLIELCKN